MYVGTMQASLGWGLALRDRRSWLRQAFKWSVPSVVQ